MGHAPNGELNENERAFSSSNDTPQCTQALSSENTRMAGCLAAECGVRQLVLTHLPPHTPDSVLLKEAREVFRGTVLAEPGLCVTC